MNSFQRAEKNDFVLKSAKFHSYHWHSRKMLMKGIFDPYVPWPFDHWHMGTPLPPKICWRLKCIVPNYHTGLICFRSFHNYAFKGWLSLETMKLYLFLVTKPLFLKTFNNIHWHAQEKCVNNINFNKRKKT